MLTCGVLTQFVVLIINNTSQGLFLRGIYYFVNKWT